MLKFQTIISVDSLAENLYAPNWLILDCRGGVLYDKKSYHNFTESHIPSSIYFCFSENSVSDTKTSTAGECLTEANQIIGHLETQGFNESSQIILYDNTSSSFTNSMWLLLRSVGCKYVAVLDGGFESWEGQNMPMSRIEKSHEKTKQSAQIYH